MTILGFHSGFRSSLPAKLALVVFVFVGTMGAVRVVSLGRLALVDITSTEVRNRWLDSVRPLDQLHDLTSDVRAAEAEVLLSKNAQNPNDGSSELSGIVTKTGEAIERYRSRPKGPDETQTFSIFIQQWNEYLRQIDAVRALSQAGDRDAAVFSFNGASRLEFNAAVTALEQLIYVTQTKAEMARNSAMTAMASAQRWISDLIIATLVLFVAIAIYLWWSVSRPLIELARLMRRLASNDTKFAVRFDGRRDEIGEMARALSVFRRNTIELLGARKNLAMQAGILARSLDKERALAREQRNFITTTSHEFRTPLTAIDGQAQRLIATKEKARPYEIADRAEKIRAAVFRMTNLVSSLTNTLQFAREEFGARTISFDLEEMLRGLVRYYREIGMGTAVEEYAAEFPERIVGDPELLYQAFSNLLSNAFKYSGQESTVHLTGNAKDGAIEIIVKDRGVGIPRDELGRIKERYYRAGNVGTIPGTGMGLYLADEIVRQHDGRLDIESEEGKGTCVSVMLPVGRLSERAID